MPRPQRGPSTSANGSLVAVCEARGSSIRRPPRRSEGKKKSREISLDAVGLLMEGSFNCRTGNGERRLAGAAFARSRPTGSPPPTRWGRPESIGGGIPAGNPIFSRVALLTHLIERLAKLPAATHELATVERSVPIPMDDGVSLLAHLYHPTSAGPAPSVLIRSPYGRRFGFLGEIFARRGFRLIIQSCRGTFGSGGVFRPQFDERADGLATLGWIERQPWYDGRLAMFGPSYLGYVQWAIAADAGTRLTALCPHITMSNLPDHWYAGGSFSLDDGIGWTALVSTQERRFAGLSRLFGQPARLVARHIDELPLLSLDERILGRPVAVWRDFVTYASAEDPFWAPADHRNRVADVRVPVAMVTGWYDIFLPIQLADYHTLTGSGNPPRLVIGPWTHTSRAGMAEQLRDSLDFL